LRLRSGQARRSRSSFGFVLKFPSTNLLCCRAPPSAPGQTAGPARAIARKSGFLFKDRGRMAAAARSPPMDERGRKARNGRQI
jgi:hypothetical protein